jgi:hypothetical protein
MKTPPAATKWTLIRVRAAFIWTLVTSGTSCCTGTRVSQQRAVFHPEYRCGTFIPNSGTCPRPRLPTHSPEQQTNWWRRHEIPTSRQISHWNIRQHFSGLNRKLSQALVPVNMSSLRYSYQSPGLASRADFDGLRPGAAGWSLHVSEKRTNGYQISPTTGIRSTRHMQSASIPSNFCQTATFLQLFVTVLHENTWPQPPAFGTNASLFQTSGYTPLFSNTAMLH